MGLDLCPNCLQRLSADDKKKIQEHLYHFMRVSNSLDPDQNQHSEGPDLDPKCLQRLSADNKGRCKYEKGGGGSESDLSTTSLSIKSKFVHENGQI